MKKASYTLFTHLLGCLFVLAISLSASVTASAQCSLVCNNFVQVSLDQTCEAEILPDMILEGGGCPNGNLQVQAKINNIWVPANGNFVATSANINQTLQVRVRDLNSGNFCWGMMKIEDKLAPILECDDIFLSCGVTNYTPVYLLDVLNISEAYPLVDENCGSYTLSYIDTYHDLNCTATINGFGNISAYTVRKWTAVDQSGNTSTCQQYLYFERRHVGDVIFPADITVDCTNPITNPSVTGVPYVSDFGQNFNIFPNNTFCELSATYTDQLLYICDGTRKILRTWTVLDWCLPNSPFPPNINPVYYVQLIKIIDDQGPEFTCPEDLTVSTNYNGCCAIVNLPNAIITDNCSRIKKISAMVITFDPYTGDQTGMYAVGGTLTTFPGNNLWDRDTLGNWGSTTCLHQGTHTVIYTAEDDCGNTSTCSFQMTVADEEPPTAVCDEWTQVGLTSNGMALVNASTFDDGSYDNCSPVTFKVRRMDANDCDDNTYFDDQVKFCCEDIGDTITVIFRVYDVPVPVGEVDPEFEEWHANDCMVRVLVEDKIKPICQSPANVTVSCENFDPSLWVYNIPLISDNCCLDSSKVYQGQIGLTHSANYNLFDTVCNRGTIVRTFRAYDCGGNSSQCTQRIIVNYEQDYFIKFPNDAIVTACNGTGVYGEPIIFGEDCELIGVNYEDQIFTVVPDACFKIERTWTIINWCTYNPNLPCIEVPNPNPNATTNHPSNLPGPTVSACGTLPPWAPTIVKINPTDPVATNYCVFYDANANCYKYKQIIKIIDTQDPEVQCPASPVTFCDLTPNNPQLWNEMYWWDNVIGSHDLCEGPTDLCITATDACSGPNINIKYLLFLDLDGDGVMETVINSVNTGISGLGWNNVPFGNAGNPNFTGGTLRQFDERGVPANQKYGFAIQTTTSGNNKTACVRWNTIQQQGTYVIPELPYGTHKIKWIVEDGCGNEKVCEYTFIVKDCKKPTVVCLNGLSVNIMPTGMITLWASDFLQYTEDNCTPADKLKIGIRKSGTGTGFPLENGQPVTSVTFTCDEQGTQLVELWSIDLAGNADFCETYVIVQDNMGICPPTPGGGAKVAGVLTTEMVEGVQDGSVQIAGSGPGIPTFTHITMSNDAGIYNFNGIPYTANSTVTPTKDDNPLNGVTTYDLVLISKHILGIEPLGSPYKMIGADANKNGSITTTDIVEFRKLILGIYPELPSNTSWRFVDKSFAFTNQNNPFIDPFPENKTIMNIQANKVNEDFVSIKVGDMNNTALANALVSVDDRSAGTLFFDVANQTVKAGEEVIVRFKAAEKMAFQFTMNFNGLDVQDVLPGDNMTRNNFGVFENAVTTSVDGDGNEFALKFRANKAGSLSDMITVSSQITKAAAYTQNGERYDVVFRFNGANGTVLTSAGFDLLQNTPNPVKGSTNISFNLPEAAEATLTISNVEGRIMKVVKAAYAMGLNTVTMNRDELESGILFYQLDTPTHSATKKMIVVE